MTDVLASALLLLLPIVSQPNNPETSTNMNKLKYLAAILIAVTGLGFQQAQAHLLDPIQFTLQPLRSALPRLRKSTLKTMAAAYQPTFLPATSQFLFKQNNDGTTDGNFGRYFTVT